MPRLPPLLPRPPLQRCHTLGAHRRSPAAPPLAAPLGLRLPRQRRPPPAFLILLAALIAPTAAPQAIITTVAGGNGGVPGGTTFGSKQGVGTSAMFNVPTGVATDPAGCIYIADSMNNVIRFYNLAGN